MLPREKLLTHPITKLDDHELIALILEKGTKKENVFNISKRILKKYDKEELKNETNLKNFKINFKLGTVQSAKLMACIELGKRLFKQKAENKYIQSYEDIYQTTKNMQYLKKEYLRAIYLNTRNKIIHDEIISIGSIDMNIIHPRELFKPAIEYSAYSIIMIHNHPSGNPQPSQADIEITQKIKQTGEILQIPLTDHIIIGQNTYYSFVKSNKL